VRRAKAFSFEWESGFFLPNLWRLRHALLLLSVFVACTPAGGKPEPSGGSASRIDASPDSSIAPPASDSGSPTAPRPPQAEDWFEDVTERSGVAFQYRNGREAGRYTLLETVGGGVGMLDFDRDGDLDLFFPGGGGFEGESPPVVTGRPGALYRNDGDWRFVDVTQEAGLGDASLYTHGCLAFDYDQDGFPDLLVTGYGGCRLYRNTQRGSFEDVTAAAGLRLDGWNTAAAAADVDRDGRPDLYVANYSRWSPEDEAGRFCGDAARGVRDVCPPQRYPEAQDRLLRNLGNGRFEEVTERAGLNPGGRGLGVIAADINQDGWIDFYVANDAGLNFLYLGATGVRFTETALLAGAAGSEHGLAEGSMGVDLGDYNADGLPDLWVVNFEMEDNSLYAGLADGLFRHATVPAKLAGHCFRYVGFGTGFADFDSDGWQDLFVVNGNVFYHVGQSPLEQPAFLFRNDSGRGFLNVSEEAGPYFSAPHPGRGAAVGDLDNDGAPDLVISHLNGPVALLRNRRPPRRWIGVQLQATRGEREAVGARVILEDQGRKLVRFVHSGAGYLSQFDPRILFPVAEETKLEVRVAWPGRKAEVFDNLLPGRTNELVEGAGRGLDEPPPQSP
jgi:hypothetical protein